MGSSVYMSILREADQEAALRQPQLKVIGDHFERNVVAFYTSHNSHYGIILDHDVNMLKDVLNGMAANGRKLLLIIDSPGGDPLAAERMVKVCREFSSNDYWVIVPNMAKSAATMISLGASKVFMTSTSELGPIDIQIPWGDELVPAHIIIKAYEDLLDKGINLTEGKRMEPILQQLQVFNHPKVEQMRLDRDLSQDIAKKVLLEGGMLENAPGKEVEAILAAISNPESLKAHGRPIFFSDFQTIDTGHRLNIEEIKVDHPVYDALHEYHMRAIFCMGRNSMAKLIETVDSALSLGIPKQ